MRDPTVPRGTRPRGPSSNPLTVFEKLPKGRTTNRGSSKQHSTNLTTGLKIGRRSRLDTSWSVRRECLVHLINFNEAHLRRALRSYAKYYNIVRMHLAVHKDAPHTLVQ